MAAESAVHIGRSDQALQFVNQVRTRARNSGNTGYPKNLTSVNFEDIYAERRVELAFEGHEFFDLVRTKRIKSELDRAGTNYKYAYNPNLDKYATMEYNENFVVGENEIFPIPPSEISLSQGRLKQNPGY